MAITEVGSGTQIATAQGTNVASQAIVFPANVAAGSLCLVVFGWWASADITVTAADTLGTPYTVLLGSAGAFLGGSMKCGIAYGIAPSGGANTVTLTPSAGSVYINAAVDEFAGTGIALDVNGGETTGSGTTASDALTTLSAGDLVVAAMVYDDEAGQSLTEGAGYTRLFLDATIARQPSAAEFKIAGAAGAEAPGWTLNASSNWRVISAAFKESAGGPAPAGSGIGLYAPRGTTQPVARGWA